MDEGTARQERLPRRRPSAGAAAGPGAELPDRRVCSGSARTSTLPATFAAFDLPTAQQVFGADRRARRDRRDRRARADRRASCSPGSRPTVGPAYDVQFARPRRPPTAGKPVHDLLDVAHPAAARVRGDRPRGRGVHHLQHLLDPRRAADARARALARDGRERDAGRGLRARRVGESSGCWRPMLGVVLGFGVGRRLCSSLLEHGRLRGSAGFDRARGPHRAWPRSRWACSWSPSRSSVVPALRGGADPADRRDRRRPSGAPKPFNGRAAIGLALDRARPARARLRARRSPVNASNVVGEIWLVAVGALMVFFGVIVLLATFARPLARRVGAPARRVRHDGRARARERDAQPTPDGRDRVRARDRARPRRPGRDLRRLDEGVGASEAVDHGITADYVLKAQQFPASHRRSRIGSRRSRPSKDVATLRFHKVRVGGQRGDVGGRASRAGSPRPTTSGCRTGRSPVSIPTGSSSTRTRPTSTT